MPQTATLFPGFREHRAGPIFARVGGAGPPLLLLHGFPQTGAMWHKISAGLAEHFTVVVADLLGYGDSDSPPGDGGAETYSKRAMARHMVDLMADLGHDTFRLAGHDRGGRVSYRLALDHPRRVERLALLDIVPTVEQFEQMGIPGGLGGFHWYFLAQPAPCPNASSPANPTSSSSACSAPGPPTTPSSARPQWPNTATAAHDPETVRSWCDDYRSGARFDLNLDRSDRSAGNRIRCPLLVLWGAGRGPSRRGRFMATWRRWADDIQGEGMPCGHFIPEEAPEECERALREFFTS